MKLQVILFFVFTISGSFSTPVDYQYSLMSDGNGNMHLVDANPQVEVVEPMFNAEADTRFLLFTRGNRLVGQQITWTRESILPSNFNAAHPVRVLIHGFNSGADSGVNIAPTAAYLQRGDYNVIV